MEIPNQAGFVIQNTRTKETLGVGNTRDEAWQCCRNLLIETGNLAPKPENEDLEAYCSPILVALPASAFLLEVGRKSVAKFRADANRKREIPDIGGYIIAGRDGHIYASGYTLPQAWQSFREMMAEGHVEIMGPDDERPVIDSRVVEGGVDSDGVHLETYNIENRIRETDYTAHPASMRLIEDIELWGPDPYWEPPDDEVPVALSVDEADGYDDDDDDDGGDDDGGDDDDDDGGDDDGGGDDDDGDGGDEDADEDADEAADRAGRRAPIGGPPY